MENRRSDLAAAKGREAAGTTETTGGWTGEKKAKIRSAPTPGDLGMVARDDAEHSSGGDIVHGQEQGSEKIEGLDWDEDKLEKEIDCCLGRLHDGVPDDDDEDGESWALDEQQLTALNQRIALYRIRAHEYEYRELDDDYQRLMLRNNGEYEDWEYYRKTCSTLEADQQFVQLWEKLASKTKLMQLYLTDSSCELPRIERLLFYHALKIAAGLPHVFKTSIHTGFKDFKWSTRVDHTWYKCYAGFFFGMWEMITKQKMNFKEALRHIHYEGKYTLCTFAWKAEFEKDEPNLDLMEQYYKPYLDRIGERARDDDDAYQLIMDSVKKFVMKPRTYYDYAKKKLAIAKEIGLIPQRQQNSTFRLHVTAVLRSHNMKQGRVGGYSNEG